MSKTINDTAVETTLVPEEPKDEPKDEKVEEKKPNVFKRAWRGVKSGARKVRESPAATIIGACVGAAATLGVEALISHRKSRYIQGELPESEPIELEECIEDEAEESEPIEEIASEE